MREINETIEIGIAGYVHDGEETHELGMIAPGRKVVYQNYAEGGEDVQETLIIRSWLSGLGGDVHIVPGILDEHREGMEHDELFSDDTKDAEIVPGQPYAREVINHDGRVGELALTHIGFALN